MNNWNWVESTDEEFEKMRKTLTYYRIYHKENGNDCVDYKFWSKNDDEAYNMLSKYRLEHTEHEYFYSSSGYYLGPDGKRYDSMSDMHKSFTNKVYDSDDREYDIQNINTFIENSFSEDRMETIDRIETLINNLKAKISRYRIGSTDLKMKIEKTDLANATEQEIENLVDVSRDMDDVFYNIRDIEYLLRTKHNLREEYNLDFHVLDDLRFNIKKMLESEYVGYPNEYLLKAEEKNGINPDDTNVTTTEDVEKCAIEMWKDELKQVLYHVNAYIFFSNYGEIEDTDNDMVEFKKAHSNEIPIKIGTENLIDYKKIDKIIDEHWNLIFAWFKKNGRYLWM